MSDEMKIVVAPDIYIAQINSLKAVIERQKNVINELRIQLRYERSLREEAAASPLPAKEEKVSRKKREVTPETNAYSDFKSDGIRKAHAADSIRSYDDFKAIQDYYLERGRVRDWMMWTVGVSMGVRVSDLFSLRFENIMNPDRTFKPRVQIYEQKTGKLNNILITESIRQSVTRYCECIGWRFNMTDCLFASKKTGKRMYEECGWRILSEAGKKLGLPLNIGSHTMRKSFANIAACVDKSSVDMNSITKIQGLLNHSDTHSTMRYLGSYQKMFDKAREAVSKFVLGESGVNEIVAGDRHTIDDIFDKIDRLERIGTEGSNV